MTSKVDLSTGFEIGAGFVSKDSAASYVVLNSKAQLYSPSKPLNEPYQPLSFAEKGKIGVEYEEIVIGKLDGKVIVLCISSSIENVDADWISFREALIQSDEIGFTVLSVARQVMEWRREHRYCGCCGSTTSLVVRHHDRYAECDECHSQWYPRIAPCMICVVVRDDKILLARNKRGSGKWYSALAGFVEPGESVEQCVHREVMEEVGVKVNSLQYISSQAWSFPHQLMLGYLCQYQSGQIQICDDELEEANWYRYDALPEVPPERSLSGQLIQIAVRGISEKYHR